MCKQKMWPSMLECQTNIASKIYIATGMQEHTMTKNEHLTSSKVIDACTGFIELIDNRTCFARKNDLTEPESQRDVYIDISQTKHNIMQMKTTDNMREESTFSC